MQQRDLDGCLGAEALEELLAASTLRSYAAGEILFAPDDHGEVLYLVKHGTVHIYCLSRSGRKLVLYECGPGTVCGLLSLVGDGCYGVFAETLEPCLLCLLPKAHLRRLGQREPRLAWRFFEAAGGGLRRAMMEHEELAFKSIRARLAGMLVALGESHGSQVENLTHQDLAERVGCYRETVSALLGELRRADMIALEPRQIRILDAAALRDIAEQDDERRRNGAHR